jgi:hypothetical protein
MLQLEAQKTAATDRLDAQKVDSPAYLAAKLREEQTLLNELSQPRPQIVQTDTLESWKDCVDYRPVKYKLTADELKVVALHTLQASLTEYLKENFGATFDAEIFAHSSHWKMEQQKKTNVPDTYTLTYTNGQNTRSLIEKVLTALNQNQITFKIQDSNFGPPEFMWLEKKGFSDWSVNPTLLKGTIRIPYLFSNPNPIAKIPDAPPMEYAIEVVQSGIGTLSIIKQLSTDTVNARLAQVARESQRVARELQDAQAQSVTTQSSIEATAVAIDKLDRTRIFDTSLTPETQYNVTQIRTLALTCKISSLDESRLEEIFTRAYIPTEISTLLKSICMLKDVIDVNPQTNEPDIQKLCTCLNTVYQILLSKLATYYAEVLKPAIDDAIKSSDQIKIQDVLQHMAKWQALDKERVGAYENGSPRIQYQNDEKLVSSMSIGHTGGRTSRDSLTGRVQSNIMNAFALGKSIGQTDF